MKAGPSALAKMRSICAALADDLREGAHFGSIMFKDGARSFASFEESDGDAKIVVQLEPDHVAALVETGRFERYPRAPSCLLVRVSALRSWEELRALLAESHQLAVTKKKTKTKKKK